MALPTAIRSRTASGSSYRHGSETCESSRVRSPVRVGDRSPASGPCFRRSGTRILRNAMSGRPFVRDPPGRIPLFREPEPPGPDGRVGTGAESLAISPKMSARDFAFSAIGSISILSNSSCRKKTSSPALREETPELCPVSGYTDGSSSREHDDSGIRVRWWSCSRQALTLGRPRRTPRQAGIRHPLPDYRPFCALALACSSECATRSATNCANGPMSRSMLALSSAAK